MKICTASIAMLALLLCACVSTPKQDAGRSRSFLPLAEGWYSYDFEKKTRGIEDEYHFAVSTGMKMVSEISLKQTGTITRFQDGIMHDPVLDTWLSIDDDGMIRGRDDSSISGKASGDGSFFWSGNIEEHGRLFHVSVSGKLTFLPPEVRAGPAYDGVYRMTDQGTGREQLVKISGGFYTWTYTDGAEAGFKPWPTLVNPDGSFRFEMDMTTVLAMGEFSRADYSTGFFAEGRVMPGQGISMDLFSHTAGMGMDQSGNAPQIYSGVVLRSGEYPNEALPAGVETISSGLAEALQRPPIDWSRYPAWYRKPPVKTGYLYAAGTKTFPDRKTAAAMAEAVAAADIAAQFRATVTSKISDSQSSAGSSVESTETLESVERIPYRVVEQIYQEDMGAAFVLVELNLDDL